jgi:hypothetical protein
MVPFKHQSQKDLQFQSLCDMIHPSTSQRVGESPCNQLRSATM